jgi:hypothetical protein
MKYKPLIFTLFTLTPVFAQLGGMGGMGGPGGGFGGPAVLGRGAGANTGQRGGSDTAINFSAGILGTIDSGLTGFQLDSNGRISNASLKGLDGFASVFGSKRLRRGSFGINYAGHYRQYSNGGNFNGTDQSVGLFFSRQVTKRSMFSSNLSATTTNRPFGIAGIGIPLDPSTSALFAPSADIFDNRIYFANGGVEYTLQKSARLSFSLNGSGFITRRTGGVLFGVNGTANGANVAYRVSRRQTVSLGYQFFMFNFTRNFGDTYGHGGFLGYSAQLGKRTQFSLQAGATRLESLGLRSARVDPVIAALIGVSTVQEVFYGISILPTGQATLTYTPNRFHSYMLGAGVMANPGNGVINTSRNTNGGFTYTYSGIRNFGLGANVGYARMASLVGDNQAFETIQSSGNVSRRMNNQIFATFSGGYRKFLGNGFSTFARNSYFVSAGLSWNPSSIPISIR